MDDREYQYGLLIEGIEHKVRKLVRYRPSNVRLHFLIQKWIG